MEKSTQGDVLLKGEHGNLLGTNGTTTKEKEQFQKEEGET
jgi:hypothetical protein